MLRDESECMHVLPLNVCWETSSALEWTPALSKELVNCCIVRPQSYSHMIGLLYTQRHFKSRS